MNFIFRFKKPLLLLADALLIMASFFLVTFFRYELITADIIEKTFSNALLALVVFLPLLFVSGLYKQILRFSGFRDYSLTAGVISFATIILFCIVVFFKDNFLSLKQNILGGIFSLILLIGMRVAVRAVFLLPNIVSSRKNYPSQKNLLVIGAGSGANLVLRDILYEQSFKYNVVGIIDDNPYKKGSSILGIRVLGSRKDIIPVCKKLDIAEILIAIPSLSPIELKKLVSVCNETGCKVKILPSMNRMLSNKSLVMQIRDVDVSDLLAREPISLNNDAVANLISGEVVLVTGGGGSIGSELCRQLASFRPSMLIIVDIYENNAYDIQNELKDKFPGLNLRVEIASVRDLDRMRQIFKKFSPACVFHAAAHKHVPLMETSPCEAVKNNVFGTLNTAKCADEFGAKRFVLVSTDKAVNPTNVMGATKRICEMIVQSFNSKSKTDFVAVRFGNVLGSNGSVIPLFKRQIAEGGPVTLTHKDIIRFFMTIPEAVQLILQATSFAEGGEIFVLDMGEPVKIYDLAENLIRLSGFKPNKDIKIIETGLRPGEKLYEELLINDSLGKTSHNKIFVEPPEALDNDEILNKLEALKEVAFTNDNFALVNEIENWVPLKKIREEQSKKLAAEAKN